MFGAFGPANDPQYAISVLLEESGYGGSVAAPVARRLFDVLRDPALLTPGARGRSLRAASTSLSPTVDRGRARLMAATTTFSTRNQVAPGALGRMSPQPGRAPGATSTSCSSGASSRSGALGCLMIFSATRGRDPSDFDTSFLFKQVLFVGIGAAIMLVRRPHRLPALPRAGPDPLRRRCC